MRFRVTVTEVISESYTRTHVAVVEVPAENIVLWAAAEKMDIPSKHITSIHTEFLGY